MSSLSSHEACHSPCFKKPAEIHDLEFPGNRIWPAFSRKEYMVPNMTHGQVYRQNGKVSPECAITGARRDCRTLQYPRSPRSKLLIGEISSLQLQSGSVAGSRTQAPGSRTQAPGSRTQAPGSSLRNQSQEPGSSLRNQSQEPVSGTRIQGTETKGGVCGGATMWPWSALTVLQCRTRALSTPRISYGHLKTVICACQVGTRGPVTAGSWGGVVPGVGAAGWVPGGCIPGVLPSRPD